MSFWKRLKVYFQKMAKKKKSDVAKKKSGRTSAEIEKLARKLQTPSGELYALSKKASSLYREVRIPKKNGGVRVLHTPRARLKELQRKILLFLLSDKEVSPYATAYRKGKSLFDNASPHTGHLYLLKMDISDFFGSITFSQVLSSAFPSARYSPYCGVMLTSLCTKDGALPQGAPTSPFLTNLVMKNFDEHLGVWCEERGISYTRYCDDLTFSADYPLVFLYQKVESMLSRWGFLVNKEKTKFISRASSQRVTGLCVNEKVSIPSEYKRSLRQEIYYALRYGPEESLFRRGEKKFDVCGEYAGSRYLQSLLGKINFVLQIEPENRYFFEKRAEIREKFSISG